MRTPGRQNLLDHQTEKNLHVMSATDQASRREDLLQAIAQEEGRLARLEADQADSRRRLDTLQAELASLGAEPEIRVRLPIAVETRVPKDVRREGEAVSLAVSWT